jgi:hypothetical protein
MYTPSDKSDSKKAKNTETLFDILPIEPRLLWCTPENSTKHQFTSEKAYFSHNPEESFSICPTHGQIVRVAIASKTPKIRTKR